MKLKSIIGAVLCAALLCGCGGGALPDGTTVPTEPPVHTTAPTETTAPVQTLPQQTEPVIADDPLSLLRADMKPLMVATAFFGYWDADLSDHPTSHLRQEFPNYWASNGYMADIGHTFGDYGTLYLVVPRTDETKISVNFVSPEGGFPYEKIVNVHDRERGEPFYVLSMLEQDDAMLEIIFEESDGRKLYWYPVWGEFRCEGTQLSAESLVADFSVYDDLPEADTANADKALDILRADMKAPLFATAYFTEWDNAVSETAGGLVKYYFPKFWGENEYLADIKDCYGNYGGLYCVVPRSEDMTVTVCTVSVEGEFPYSRNEELTKRRGSPFFALGECNGDLMIEVRVETPGGETAYWYPSWSETQGSTQVLNPGTLMADFSPPSEMTPRQTMMTNGWTIPEDSDMDGHFWLSHYLSYGLDLLPGGEAILYDVDDGGAYHMAFEGEWVYKNGYLYLHMIPSEGSDYEEFAGTFPVLLDPYGYGDLWLGRSEDGTALPYFTENTDYDELEQPKG